MARPPGADDEYQDLQKRFQILESDRKNLFEHTQLEVKKNKEALAKLKKENKELRSSLSSLMSVLCPRLRAPAQPCVASKPRRPCRLSDCSRECCAFLPSGCVRPAFRVSCTQERSGAVDGKGLRNQQA